MGVSYPFTTLASPEFEILYNGNCKVATPRESLPKFGLEYRLKSYKQMMVFLAWDLKENILAALSWQKSGTPIRKIFTELLHILMFLARRIGEC